MRAALVLALVAYLAAPAAARQQTGKRQGPPRKGDSITVRGCLSGSALEAAGLQDDEAIGTLATGLTFRLTGDRKLLKQMRDEFDGKVVDVEGVLKSELPRENQTAAKLGRMRIAIGSPSATPGSPAAEARRSVPVLEVKSFQGSPTGCGR
jgi:hypothetical protein